MFNFGHHGQNQPAHPPAAAGAGGVHQPTYKILSRAEENYCLTVRDGNVVLAPANPRDEHQHWYKDMRFSTQIKDEEGNPAFALVNKATGLAIKHSLGQGHPDEARGALESALWQKKTEFEKWGLEIERRQQRGRRGGPAAGGGGWSGGGEWFRWFSGGGFWNSAKQTVLTILGIVAAFFLIANFNVLVAAVVNSLLAVLRQIRRVLTFVAHCVSQGISVSASGHKSTSVESGNLAAMPVEVRAGMSAKERVVRKWGMD